MNYVSLGSTGLKVSRLCLGMMTYGSRAWRDWVLDEEESLPLIRAAIDAGINYFDTADMYSDGRSEEILGRAIRELTSRDRVVVATKVYFPMGDGPNDRGLSRKHILQAVDASLRRLQTDYIDLYQIHRFDYETPIEETLEALHDLVRAGKVRYLGASSMFAWQFATMLYTADRYGWTRFVSMQNHYNLVYREEEREMIPFCHAEGIAIVPWSPLARGLLTRKRSDEPTTRARIDTYAHQFYTTEDLEIVDRVATLAERREVPQAQIALAWVLQQPGVTAPIIGVSKPHHLTDALGALAIELSSEDRAFLEQPYRPHRVLGHS